MRTHHVLLAFIAVSIWGASFVIVKIGLGHFPPFLFSALRFLAVASMICVVPRPRLSWFFILVVGFLLGIVKFSLLFLAMDKHVTAGSAALLLQTQIFFTIGLGVVFFGDRLTWRQLIGIGLAVFGVVVFVSAPESANSLHGVTLVLLAALSWAVVNLLMKHVAPAYLLPLIVWASLAPPVPLLIISLLFEEHAPMLLLTTASPAAWVAVAYMGFFSTLVAYALWGGLLARYPAVRVAPFALLIPLIAISASALFLREALLAREIVGLVAVFAGLALCVISFDRLWAGLGKHQTQSPQVLECRADDA